MRYKLLNNGAGVIVSRCAEVIRSDIEIAFEGVPDGATAVFTVAGMSYYREINNGTCRLEFNLIGGEIGLIVAVMDGKVGSPRFTCEGILANKLADGSVLVVPSDGDLPGVVSRLCIENHNLREKNDELEKRIGELEKNFTKLFEGYDII